MKELVINALNDLKITSISKRGAKTGSGDDFMVKYMLQAAQNEYHPDTNPKGIVNLGTAVNCLMEEELQERLNRDDVFKFQPEKNQHYFIFGGLEVTRRALSEFFGRHLSNGKLLPINELVIMNGVSSCLDSLAFGLVDEGEVIITPTPVYGRIFTDLQDRAYADVQPLHLLPKEYSGTERDFELRPKDLEKRIQELTAEGKRVKAFILLNPQNPLGDICSKEQIMGLLTVCAKHKIHAIVDEIYALSMMDKSQFTSVLSIEHLPDPNRTHFLWGMSKDFGLAGFRFGVIHTRNEELLRYLAVVSMYQATPSIIQEAVATLLNDEAWCDNFFLPTSQRRLTLSYERTVHQLTAAGMTVHQSKAGFYVWINITPFMNQQTITEELEVFEELMAAGVYTIPGSTLHCKVPGWVRIIFTVSENNLDVGLKRFISVLQSRKTKNLKVA
uniref:1-aminocyclopropane-1-carboxylate synthase-like protein 1 n=1 Tax=Hirondellea gigas TaxID=1518452 RepID=A0A2P2I1Q6_9CRUS